MSRTRGLALLGSIGFLPVLFATTAKAHCPLCSAGAGGFAAVASALGVGLEIVGVFVGAFGIATGLWTSRYITEQYLPRQKWIVSFAVYLTIVVPLLPMMTDHVAVSVSIAGEYGSALNRLYLLNSYMIGAVLGGLLTAATPRMSEWITEARGSTVPFQGMTLTFGLLGSASLLLHTVL